MTCYIYIRNDKYHPEIQNYLIKNQLNIESVLQDDEPIKVHWTERKINFLLQKMTKGDSIVVYDLIQMTSCFSQILEILMLFALQRVSVHIVKYNAVIDNDKVENNTVMLFNLISRIEANFTYRRINHIREALARHKAKSIPLSHTKNNVSLNLQKIKNEQEKYIILGISKQAIKALCLF